MVAAAAAPTFLSLSQLSDRFDGRYAALASSVLTMSPSHPSATDSSRNEDSSSVSDDCIAFAAAGS